MKNQTPDTPKRRSGIIKRRHNPPGKKTLILIVGIILLCLAARLLIFTLFSEGLDGIDILVPLQLFGFVFFALAMEGFIAAWVYEDCRIRGGDGALWAVVVFFTTPFIGLLVYFLRRPEITQHCPACGHRISLKAKYCEECGIRIEQKEVPVMPAKTHHLKYLTGGAVSLILMLVCFIGFIFTVAHGGVNTSVTSDKRIWNTGIITMSMETNFGGVWSVDFKSASDGFIKEKTFTLDEPEQEILTADIHCGTVPDGATLMLWIVQGEKAESIDVTNLSEPLEYSLDGFESGKIFVRLQINGVKDVSSDIEIISR